MTIQTIRQCRSEESFNSVWQILLVMALKIKRWLTSSQFELREAWALWETPSRSLEDFVGDHVQRQTQLTSESHHRASSSLPPPPPTKNSPHTYDIIGLFDPSFSITDTETINKLRQDISDIQETTKRLISCSFVLWSSIVLILTLRRWDIFSSPNLFLCINGTNCRLVLLS